MQARVAKRYAKALFDLSSEQQSLNTVYDDISFIHQTVKEIRDLGLLLKTPIVTSDRKEKIMDAILSGKVTPLTQAYIKLIIGKGRESALPDITTQFISLYKEYKGITSANVTTAVPLKEETKSAIIALVEEATKKKVELAATVDKNIIGGFILKVGDKQYDTTISRKLEELKRSFSKNIYLKDY